MPFDTVNTASTLRSPFAAAKLNGVNMTGLIAIEVTQNSHFTADHYRATFAVSSLPLGYDIGYFSNSADDELELIGGVSINGNAPTLLSLIIGQIDQVDVDIIQRTMTLTGRDFSARFIDNKTAELFQNQSASDVVKTLAARRGLSANVTDTTTKVGTYYEIDHASLTREQNEWDLLTYLAEKEGFDIWVSGKTVYFKPPIAETVDPYLLVWSETNSKASNFENLKMIRSQTLAKDVIVRVRSWNQAEGKAFTVDAKINGVSKSQRLGGQSQLYSFTVPNLNKEQAQQWATAKATQISKHERVITAMLAGDNLMDMRKPVKLVGTNTSWDQIYYLDTITRSISYDSGYKMEIRAKNHSTESTVIA